MQACGCVLAVGEGESDIFQPEGFHLRAPLLPAIKMSSVVGNLTPCHPQYAQDFRQQTRDIPEPCG